MADEVRMKNQGKEKPMDDLISKQAVLDLFKEYQPNLAVKVYEFGERLKALEPVSIVEAEPDKGWISVKDRPPDPETWVMVYIKYPSPVFEMGRGIQKMSSIKKMFYDGKSFYCDFGTVTHWMPLPEPPKGE